MSRNTQTWLELTVFALVLACIGMFAAFIDQRDDTLRTRHELRNSQANATMLLDYARSLESTRRPPAKGRRF